MLVIVLDRTFYKTYETESADNIPQSSRNIYIEWFYCFNFVILT